MEHTVHDTIPCPPPSHMDDYEFDLDSEVYETDDLPVVQIQTQVAAI